MHKKIKTGPLIKNKKYEPDLKIHVPDTKIRTGINKFHLILTKPHLVAVVRSNLRLAATQQSRAKINKNLLLFNTLIIWLWILINIDSGSSKIINKIIIINTK